MSLDPSDLALPGWSCLHFVTEPIEATELEALGLSVTTIDASPIEDPPGLLAGLAAGLAFPEYFGNNWDAVDECLRDLSWGPGDLGWILIVRNADTIWRADPVAAGALAMACQEAARHWAEHALAFHLIFEL